MCMMGKCVCGGGGGGSRYVCLEKRSGVIVVCVECVVDWVDIFGT